MKREKEKENNICYNIIWVAEFQKTIMRTIVIIN